jgi:hypothetical protein
MLIIPTLNLVYLEDCNFRYRFKTVKYCVTLDFLAAEVSVLLGCDTVPLVCSFRRFLPNASNCSPNDTALHSRELQSSNTTFLLDKS